MHTREEARFFKAQEEKQLIFHTSTRVQEYQPNSSKKPCLCSRIRRKLQRCSLRRATWAGSVEAYIKDGEAAAREWLRTTGFENIDELNKVLKTTATSWKERVEA